jgi:hypothetical protein
MTFKQLVHFLAPPLAVLALTGAHYHGDRLSITFPDGWSAPAEKDTKGLVETREADPGANCNVQTTDIASMAGDTLEEINSVYGHVFKQADWADLLGVDEKQLTVVASEIRPFADAYFHIGTLRIQINGQDVRARYGFYVLPGRVTMAGCYAAAPDYAAHSALFEKTIDSFRPW